MAVIIDNGQAHTVIVERRRTVAAVNKVSVPIKVSSPGPQGAKGDAGASGDGTYPAFDVSFGDASGVVMVLGSGMQEVTLVSMQVEQPFNGAGASVAIGIAGDDDLLMSTDFNDPGTLGTYESAPRVELPGGTQIRATIVNGAGATTGRAQFVIQATPLS